MCKQGFLLVQFFLQLYPLVFGLLHLAVQHDPVLFQLFEFAALLFQVDLRHFQPVVPENAAHMLAQLFHHSLMRYGRQVLLDQRPAVPAKHLCKVQGIQKGQDQVAAAKPLRKAFLCGRCPVHRQGCLTALPRTADLMCFPVIRADGKLYTHKRGRFVLQPVQIPAAEDWRAGERIGDRVRDRTFALVVVARDCCHAAECPGMFACKAAKTGDRQLHDLQRCDLCHQHTLLCAWFSIQQCRTETALS